MHINHQEHMASTPKFGKHSKVSFVNWGLLTKQAGFFSPSQWAGCQGSGELTYCYMRLQRPWTSFPLPSWAMRQRTG